MVPSFILSAWIQNQQNWKNLKSRDRPRSPWWKRRHFLPSSSVQGKQQQLSNHCTSFVWCKPAAAAEKHKLFNPLSNSNTNPEKTILKNRVPKTLDSLIKTASTAQTKIKNRPSEKSTPQKQKRRRRRSKQGWRTRGSDLSPDQLLVH